MPRKGQAVKMGKAKRYKSSGCTLSRVRANTVESITEMDIISISVTGTRKSFNKNTVVGRSAGRAQLPTTKHFTIVSQDEIKIFKAALVSSKALIAKTESAGIINKEKAQMIAAARVYGKIMSQEERDIDRTIEILKKYIQ